MSDDFLLRTEGLIKRYAKRTVVQDVSIALAAGEVVGLLGPNGAGKTTTFSMVVGLVKPNAGRIWFDGEDITKLPMYKRARRGMAYLAQEPSVFREMTARDNILAVLEHHKVDREEREQVAHDLMGEFHIRHIADSMA